MKTHKLLLTLFLFLTMLLAGCAFIAPAENPAPLPWMGVAYDSGYSIEYPLATYSMRDGHTGPEVLFPGVKVLVPNDLFYFQEPRAATYKLSIAVTVNSAGLTLNDAKALLANSQIVAYDPAVFDNAVIQPATLGGEPALRVDDLPVGPAGVTTQIVAIHGPFIYELMVEPHQLTGNQAAAYIEGAPSPDNRALMEQIIATFGFTDDQAAPAATAPVLSWQGHTEFGDGDATRCKEMALYENGAATLGDCSGATEDVTLGERQQNGLAAAQAHFATMSIVTEQDQLSFQGAGAASGPAWERALLAWTHLTYAELSAERVGATMGAALSWLVDETSDQPGQCNHLLVTPYGYAYADQVPCQGGQAQNQVGGWLSDEEMAAFDGWYYGHAPLYVENSYLDGKGDDVMTPAQSAAVAAWASAVYERLATPGGAESNTACTEPFAAIRAASAAEIDKVVTTFEMPIEGEPMLLGWEPGFWDGLVTQLVAAGANYLNACADPDAPLAVQATQLAQLSQVIPTMDITIPGKGDFFPLEMQLRQDFQPVTQLMDIDQDGNDEIVLHTQAPYIDGEQLLFGVRGGISIVYAKNEAGWYGQVIAPTPHYVAPAEDVLRFAPFRDQEIAAQRGWSATQALTYDPAPQVQLLNVRDDAGNAYLAVSQVRRTPVDDIRELSVLRWQNGQPELALQILLDNWCVSADWTIKEDGSISVPALPEPFPHCQGQYAARTFVLRGGRYVTYEE